MYLRSPPKMCLGIFLSAQIKLVATCLSEKVLTLQDRLPRIAPALCILLSKNHLFLIASISIYFYSINCILYYVLQPQPYFLSSLSF